MTADGHPRSQLWPRPGPRRCDIEPPSETIAGGTPGLSLDDITVIVPTMNEADNIARFLGALPERIHLIVVDSSSDATPDIIQRVRPDATTLIRAAASIPVARQLGADTASAPWLLFTDADVVFRPDYFHRLATVAVDSRLAGLYGTKATVDGFDTYHRLFRFGQRALARIGIPSATGSNLLVRRDALQTVGGFDAALTVNEDTELFFRLVRRRLPVAFRPDLVVSAFDHRRLELGVVRKVAHGAVRNTALYLDIAPNLVRRSDWGYWARCSDPVES